LSLQLLKNKVSYLLPQLSSTNPPDQKLGLLTKRQFQVLKSRLNGHSQLETAKYLGTSRANVSMIELRGRKKIERAKETLKAYESILSWHSIVIPKGTRLQEIPSIVLHEGDRHGIHLRSNLIDVIRMVKDKNPASVKRGRSTRSLNFIFTQSGVVKLQMKQHQDSRHQDI
jgi:HTH-type transcriptional regulator, fmd operon transcriptional regulator